jgi:hypothetical protein
MMLNRLEQYIINFSRQIKMQSPVEPKYRKMYTPSKEFKGILCDDLKEINEKCIVTLVLRTDATDPNMIHRYIINKINGKIFCLPGCKRKCHYRTDCL